MILRVGTALAERGIIPIKLLRWGIRNLIQHRIREINEESKTAFIQELLSSPIAIATEAANEQHYEVTSEFFEMVLGDSLKYSACYWPDGVETLSEAEEASLAQVCERAKIQDGQRILDLGCGWGSFSLYVAKHFPNATITSVSNSESQRRYIESHGSVKVRVLTADINNLDLHERFDRIVSIEMFEHLRNYHRLFKRLSGWLRPGGHVFVHVFCHRSYPYPFDTIGENNWMGRHFFTGGIMPSLDLFHSFNEHLSVEDEWALDGTHYQRTAAAWRENLEVNQSKLVEVLSKVYGRDAVKWLNRWRLFFLACEELFGYRNGSEWLVGHYRFSTTTRTA